LVRYVTAFSSATAGFTDNDAAPLVPLDVDVLVPHAAIPDIADAATAA
jgi:hypothetical protein